MVTQERFKWASLVNKTLQFYGGLVPRLNKA